MPEIKLAKLPDRTPVKHSFSASPELNQALLRYAAFYQETYGQQEEVADLIPFILQTFLGADRSFTKFLKEKSGENRSENENNGAGRGRRRASANASATPSS